MKNPYKYILEIKEKSFTQAQLSMQKALIELLREKDYSDIYVKELCKSAHVARSTFYAYYQNTDEILEDIEDKLTSYLLGLNKEIMKRGLNKKEELIFYSETFDYVNENKVIFYTLLISRTDYRFIEKWKTAIKYHFWERIFSDKAAKNSGLILEMVSSLAISAYSYWLKNPYEIDIEGVYSIISNILKTIDYEE